MAKVIGCLSDLRGAIAAWVLGLLPGEDLPAIATTALLDGFDNSSLRQLAGLLSPRMVDANDLLQRAVEECGFTIPDRRSAAVQYASCVSRLILARTVTPYDGAEAIWRASIAVEDPSFHALDPFIYASSEYEARPDDKLRFERAIVEEAARWAGR